MCVCPVCGRLLTGRQKSACSPKHRAAVSRRTRVHLPVDEAREIRAKLATIRDAVWEAKATLEKYASRRGRALLEAALRMVVCGDYSSP